MSSSWELTTPVVFIIFNRPDTTERVFERINAVEPSELFIIADGPREDYPGDVNDCAAAREIVTRIEWECDVHRLYREQNTGLPEAVYEGLDWVFEQVPEAIVLEDDTVPNRDFFRFCETMLERYHDDERVMSITGTNRLETWKDDRQDYHFVTYQGVWGWATWRRAWELYDPEMRSWPDPEVQKRIRDFICDDERFEYHRPRFQSCYEGRAPAWSKRWEFAHYLNSGLSVVPSRNLVSNVGFDERGLHTTDPDDPLADLPQQTLEFPLEKRTVVAPDREYERRCFEQFRRPSRTQRLLSRVPQPVVDAVPTPLKRGISRRFL